MGAFKDFRLVRDATRYVVNNPRRVLFGGAAVGYLSAMCPQSSAFQDEYFGPAMPPAERYVHESTRPTPMYMTGAVASVSVVDHGRGIR